MHAPAVDQIVRVQILRIRQDHLQLTAKKKVLGSAFFHGPKHLLSKLIAAIR